MTMEYKPNDVFVGVIDFFGILVPGAVLLFLHGDLILSQLGLSCRPDDKVFYWVSFFVGSLLLGHFLTGISVVLLNRSFGLSWEKVDLYYKEVEDAISLPVPKNRKAAYHRAYSFIRLNSPAGISEIDRQVSEYKLFRALTIVFLLDFLFALAKLNLERMAVSLVLVLLSWYRFAYLVCWTQKMTFEFYVLLTKNAPKNAPGG
jgi:hypothetical protein